MSPVPTNYKHNLIRLSAPFWQQHTAPCVGGFQNAVSSQAKVKCRIFAHLLCTVPCLLPGAFLCILKYLISLAYHHPHRFGRPRERLKPLKMLSAKKSHLGRARPKTAIYFTAMLTDTVLLCGSIFHDLTVRGGVLVHELGKVVHSAAQIKVRNRLEVGL